MSNGIPSRRTRRGRKPQKYTNWPAIYGVLGLLLLLACCFFANLFAKRPKFDGQPAASTHESSVVDKSRHLAVPRVVYLSPRNYRHLSEPTVLEQPPSRPPGVSAEEAALAAATEHIDPLAEPLIVLPAEPVSRTEEELLALLGVFHFNPQQRRFADVDLDAAKGTTDALRKSIGTEKAGDIDGWLAFAQKRADLKGLPFRKGKDCRMEKRATNVMAHMSDYVRRVRRTLAMRKRRQGIAGGSYATQKELDEAEREFADRVIAGVPKQANEAIPAVVQILQAEGEITRTALVEFLAEVDGPNATAALAQRALFDFSPDLRRASVAALKRRPAKDYRKRLLEGFRYPWPPVADHAALALVAVDDKEAVNNLVELLDEPDPGDPFPLPGKGNKWGMRELVRINHLRNCMLCHAPSTDREDPIRGFIPHPNRPIVQYYESRSGDFVRADVTYLKQDFSITHRVVNPGKWPAEQRFDFLVRTRELTLKEVAELVPSPAGRVERSSKDATYPQREAVLYALRKLTGLDAGKSSEMWREMLGKARR